MTLGRARCDRAFGLDLVSFVHDARGPRWEEFREHYPLCPDCSAEVRTWTELEIVLQGGSPPATAHPAPDDLLRLEGGGSGLDPDYRRIVEYHVQSCRPCADEIATLRTFDFESLYVAAGSAASTTIAAPVDTHPDRSDEPGQDVPSHTDTLSSDGAERPAVETEAVAVATETETATSGSEVPSVIETEAATPGSEGPSAIETETATVHSEPASVVEEPAVDIGHETSSSDAGEALDPDLSIDLVEPESQDQAALDAGVEIDRSSTEDAFRDAVPDHDFPGDGPGSEASTARTDASPVAVSDGGFLPPEALVEGYPTGLGEDPAATVAPGFVRRVAQVARHPAAGVTLIAVLLLPVLWVGELPRFPFGAPAGEVSYELPEIRVAVATVDDVMDDIGITEKNDAPEDLELELPSALSGIEVEELPPSVEGPETQVALASNAGDTLGQAPGLLVPDEVADVGDAVDPWALTRLDKAGPVEIIATQLVAGLELEVPVPLTVPAGAVLQVQITGEGQREIIERLSFPGAREVALRVPAAWLVPGTYQVDVGVVRRGPAPVRVARYGLVVH